MGRVAEALDWWVAADDRWHTPRDEPSVRQRRVLGAPVLETRAAGAQRRRPAARLLHGRRRRPHRRRDRERLAAAVRGGLQPRRAARRSGLRPTSPIEGIELPPAAVVVPVGHRSVVRIALAHDGRGAGTPGPAAAGRRPGGAGLGRPDRGRRARRGLRRAGRRPRGRPGDPAAGGAAGGRRPCRVPPRPHRAGAAGPARRAVGRGRGRGGGGPGPPGAAAGLAVVGRGGCPRRGGRDPPAAGEPRARRRRRRVGGAARPGRATPGGAARRSAVRGVVGPAARGADGLGAQTSSRGCRRRGEVATSRCTGSRFLGVSCRSPCAGTGTAPRCSGT